MNERIERLLLVVVSSGALLGQIEADGQTLAAHESDPASAAAAAKKQPPGRVSPGKPVAPIAIAHRLAESPRLGRPVQIELTIDAGVAIDDVVIALGGDDGLLVEPPQTIRVARISAAAPFAFAVTVTPLELDLLYLRVFVEADIGGLRQGRAVTVPLRLGSPIPVRAGAVLRSAPSGQLLHSLPAQPRQARR